MRCLCKKMVKPVSCRWRTCRRILTTLLFLACIAVASYQSVLSTLRFHKYPITVSISERDVEYKDYPYLVMCNQGFLKNRILEGIPSATSFMSFYKQTLQIIPFHMQSYPWATLPFKTFYEARLFDYPSTFVKTFSDLIDYQPPKDHGSNTPKQIYSAEAGMCTYMKLQVTERKVKMVELLYRKEIEDDIVVALVDNVRKLPKLFGRYNDETTFLSFSKTANKKFAVGIKNQKKLSAKGYTCTEEPNYTQNECLDKCFHKGLLEKNAIVCTLPWFANISDVEDCSSYEDYKQLINVLTNVSAGNDDVINKCRKECPPACTDIIYSFTESPLWKSPFTGLAYMEFSFQQTVKEVEEIAVYEFINWLGDVGGIFGIFLGVSIFGLYQQFVPEADD